MNPFPPPPPPPPFNEPKYKYAESALQKSDSDNAGSESIEASNDQVSSPPRQQNLPASASSSEVSFAGENAPSSFSQLTHRHSNPQGSHAAEEKRDHLPAEETSRRDSSKFLEVMEIVDERDMGKHLLGLAIPMGVVLVLSGSSLVKTTEMRIVVIILSFATALLCNGFLLRKTYRNSSTFILLSGAALMMLSYYVLVGCYLPVSLKWIPILCWLASLVPLAMYGLAHFRGDKMKKDPENGE